jgi:hypothetical protein
MDLPMMSAAVPSFLARFGGAGTTVLRRQLCTFYRRIHSFSLLVLLDPRILSRPFCKAYTFLSQQLQMMSASGLASRLYYRRTHEAGRRGPGVEPA